MIVLDNPPGIKKLRELIDKIPGSRYPITVEQLVDFAHRQGVDWTVIDFYKTFPEDQVFRNKQDLLARSEQVELFQEQDEDLPAETLHSPQD
jgi:hypothetical protein